MGRRGSKPSPEVLDRQKRVLKAYVEDDMSMKHMAQRYGITRQRIHQGIYKEDKTLYLLAKRRRKARTRLKQFVNDEQIKTFVHCQICGELFQEGRRKFYCSPMCYKIFLLFRYSIDEEFWKSHRKAVAKSTLRHATQHTNANIRYAVNVLDEEVESRGRWFVRGSITYHWALRAYALGWPLFDKLHPELQQQIREDSLED